MAATRWSLIGATTIALGVDGQRHRETGGEIVNVMKPRCSARAGLRRRVRHPACGDRRRAALDGVDAVYISTTNERHYEECMAAARAGKHVLCEKPLATSYEDAAEMVEACRAAGVIMATNHHLRKRRHASCHA